MSEMLVGGGGYFGAGRFRKPAAGLVEFNMFAANNPALSLFFCGFLQALASSFEFRRPTEVQTVTRVIIRRFSPHR